MGTFINKGNEDSDSGIDQIKRKDYSNIVLEYSGEVVLVGINYDKNGTEGKQHTCKIERIIK